MDNKGFVLELQPKCAETLYEIDTHKDVVQEIFDSVDSERKVLHMSRALNEASDQETVEETMFGFKNETKLAALITPFGAGGSHFILHHLQGHPNIVTLKENGFANSLEFQTPNGPERPVDHQETGHVIISTCTYSSDLKRFFVAQRIPARRIIIGQEELHPQKLAPNPRSIDPEESYDLWDHWKNIDVKWMFLNSPPTGRLSYNEMFEGNLGKNRDRIAHFYCFRGPMSSFYSWKKSRIETAQEKYGPAPDEKAIYDWVEKEYMTSLFHFARIYDPERDHIFNLEQFACNMDSALGNMFRVLNVPVIKEGELRKLDYCTKCYSADIEEREHTHHWTGVKRKGKTLFCNECDPAQLGPGRYNYIGKRKASSYISWKKESGHEEIYKKFEKVFGKDLMNYFNEETYIEDKTGEVFKSRIENLLKKMRDFSYE